MYRAYIETFSKKISKLKTLSAKFLALKNALKICNTSVIQVSLITATDHPIQPRRLRG